jgi:hypothetical protein
MKLSIGYLPNSDLAEKLLEHFLIPGTVPSLPSDSDSAQTLDQLLEEDYQDSQIDPDNLIWLWLLRRRSKCEK